MDQRSSEEITTVTRRNARRDDTAPARGPRPTQSLSRRLLFITFVAVMCLELLFFVPALANARSEWLQRRVIEAQIAALSALQAPDDALDPKLRDELLRLSGTEAIRIETPSRTLLITGERQATPIVERIDLPDENRWSAGVKAVRLLFVTDDGLTEVTAPSSVPPNSRVVVTLHRLRQARYLRNFAGPSSLYSFMESIMAGLLVYAACHIMFVRPMRRVIDSIHRFRADPERAARRGGEKSTPRGEMENHRDDEIALAARELDAMQAELRAALWRNARLAAIGTAVAKVSHDLRGVLSPAMLVAERLQSNADPSVSKAGGILINAVERAVELVRGPLDFAREGPIAPAKARVALFEILDNLAERMRGGDHRVAVDLKCDPEIEVTGDGMLLERIFANLMRNSADAGCARLRIAAAKEANEVVVDVVDDAGGLPATVRENLFKPFIASSRPGGAGLGLAIVRDLVHAQGGAIALQETGPAGTVFRIRLPAAAVRTAAAPRPTPGAGATAGG